MALVIGAAYLNQPLTAAGAFTRGSVIFVAMLSCTLDTFGEVSPAELFCNDRVLIKTVIVARTDVRAAHPQKTDEL